MQCDRFRHAPRRSHRQRVRPGQFGASQNRERDRHDDRRRRKKDVKAAHQSMSNQDAHLEDG